MLSVSVIVVINVIYVGSLTLVEEKERKNLKQHRSSVHVKR